MNLEDAEDANSSLRAYVRRVDSILYEAVRHGHTAACYGRLMWFTNRFTKNSDPELVAAIDAIYGRALVELANNTVDEDAKMLISADLKFPDGIEEAI